jgi:hypothetical protein
MFSFCSVPSSGASTGFTKLPLVQHNSAPALRVVKIALRIKFLDFAEPEGIEDLNADRSCIFIAVQRLAAQTCTNDLKGILVETMNGQSVERLMDIILQMKINLAHINETLAQQTDEIREQLGLVFGEEKATLERSLGTIDEKLQQCSTLIADYQRRHTELSSMREKLVQRGAEPSPLPPVLPREPVENIKAWRLRGLRDEGRL